MITIRRADARGTTDFGWLDSRHSFSFGGYHDPRHMGFRALRVINDDRVAPGQGFGTHTHRDMEILSWVVEGAMEHRDSLGNGSVIRPGELQRMTAGTGVAHSEFNHSRKETLRFLQIWILPERSGIRPGYEQTAFPLDRRRGELVLVASRDGRDGSVEVHQDVSLRAGRFAGGDEIRLPIPPGRHAWVQVVSGGVGLNGLELEEGDGAALSEEDAVAITARSAAEVLVFELG